MAKSSIQEVICKQCGISFKKRVKHDKPGNHYCSNKCRMSDKDSYKSDWTVERRKKMSDKMSGESNPNYGNKWTEEQRSHLSEYKIRQYKANPDLAYECGKSNRGVKFSKERIEAMHGNRTKESYVRHQSDASRKIIGKKSKEKFTPEYKDKFRKTMEESGHWIPFDQKDQYSLYYEESNWIGSMFEYLNKDESQLLKEYGLFNRYNSNGYVRDHIVPRKVGFEYGLPAFILRHPANLQFISHGDNIRKGFSDRRFTENQKECIIEALFERIVNFNKEWIEQEICLSYIKERRAV